MKVNSGNGQLARRWMIFCLLRKGHHLSLRLLRGRCLIHYDHFLSHTTGQLNFPNAVEDGRNGLFFVVSRNDN